MAPRSLHLAYMQTLTIDSVQTESRDQLNVGQYMIVIKLPFNLKYTYFLTLQIR